MVRASSRPRSSSGRNAPEPRFTSSTRPVSPSASFLLMMLAAMSGIDSTVAGASRSAYIFRSAGAISAVWPISAQPIRATCASRFGERQVGAKAGDGLELVERAAGVAEAAARHHRHGDAAARDQRREHERHLVAHAARRVLVDHGSAEALEVEAVAGGDHRVGERSELVGRESAPNDRHQQGGELVVRDPASDVAVDDGPPLGGLERSAVALALDQRGNHDWTRLI